MAVIAPKVVLERRRPSLSPNGFGGKEIPPPYTALLCKATDLNVDCGRSYQKELNACGFRCSRRPIMPRSRQPAGCQPSQGSNPQNTGRQKRPNLSPRKPAKVLQKRKCYVPYPKIKKLDGGSPQEKT